MTIETETAPAPLRFDDDAGSGRAKYVAGGLVLALAAPNSKWMASIRVIAVATLTRLPTLISSPTAPTRGPSL